ncbi:MAG TPA: hypothetical protein VJ869_01240 [Sphaerochaeta sp.]|nr:hypothetical protein [Sphaerochaeta sp.]
MNNLKEIKKTCDLFMKAYKSYDDFILDWVESKSTIKKTVNAIFAKSNEVKMPPEYWEAQASLYVDGHMLTDPKVIRKMRNAVGAFVPEEVRNALSFWTDNPGFWCFWVIKEALEDDFFIIEDLHTRQTHLMHSPDTTYLQTDKYSRNKHYLCLMLPNGLCLQTIGIPLFNSLSASEMQFFFALFSPGLELGPAINKNFLRLLDLEDISGIPLFVEGNAELKQTWQPFKLKSFSLSDLKGTWESKKLGNLQLFSFMYEDNSYASLPNFSVLETEQNILTVHLVRDNKSGEMALFTSTDASYTLFAALLMRSIPELTLPKKPSVSISLVLAMLLAEGNYPLPWKKFKQILDVQSDHDGRRGFVPELPPGKQQELWALIGEDQKIDIRNILPSTQAEDSTYRAEYQVDPADKGYELFGWPKPPKQIQSLFTSPLNDSAVFEVVEDNASLEMFNTLTNSSYAKEIGNEGLASFITALFVDYFPSSINLELMNSFIWLLLYKGKESLPARSYAIELLKMHSLALTDIYFEGEAFLQDFTKFIRKILCTRGLCSLSSRPKGDEVAKGTYTIRGTGAFYSLVKPAEYRVY